MNKAQSTKHKAQSTKHKAQSTKLWLLAVTSILASVALAQPSDERVSPMTNTAPTPFPTTQFVSPTVAPSPTSTPIPASTPAPTAAMPTRITRATGPTIAKLQVYRNGTWYDADHPISILINDVTSFRAISSTGEVFPSGSVSWSYPITGFINGGYGGNVAFAPAAKTTSDGLFLTATAGNSVSALVIVGQIGLYNVSFGNDTQLFKDADGSAYDKPAWQSTKSTASQSPICYYGGQTLNVGANFYIDPPNCVVNTRIRAFAEGGGVTYPFPLKSVTTGSSFNYTSADAANAMATSVIIYPSLSVRWEVEAQARIPWATIGTSYNKMYRTLGKPTDDTPMYLTVVDVACRNAQGSISEGVVASQIWNVFRTRHVSSAEGREMSYWVDASRTASLAKIQGSVCQNIAWMINPNPQAGYEDLLSVGTCAAWSHLFKYALRCHGISSCSIFGLNPAAIFNSTVEGNALAPAIMVKNWSFSGAGSVPDKYTPWSHQQGEFSDASGVSAQAVANPYSLFGNHFIVGYGGQYYDPSYGTDPLPEMNQWENASVDGFTNYINMEVSPGVFQIRRVAKQNNTSVQEIQFTDAIP